jgi:3-methyl-2-oxobutanoate hydroxymethyltransferase
LESAGIDLLVLECVPSSLAKRISAHLTIPVIGIGAGAQTDGQVLVVYDILGLTFEKTPRFSRNFLLGHDSIAQAIQAYVDAVRSGAFPQTEHEVAR